ncbi:MAG: hypothetical protein JWO67_1963 [Streptosporangiaceae bacterium]|nr:hypothetical protein [Streptosporangiaceae bacterium]
MPGPGEPLWLPEDRWWALALLEAESGLCRDCGHLLAETTHIDAEYAYDAQLTKCHACAAGALRMTQHQENGGRTEGIQVGVFRRKQL